jgi:hypothetical protein
MACQVHTVATTINTELEQHPLPGGLDFHMPPRVGWRPFDGPYF